ncbi:MAG: chromosomal replication initiator protein [Candidatus Krumholzibacteriia bacterium]|jgi:chromosomal replication initiator protein
MTNLDAYWPEILDVVRQRVALQTFNTWFVPLQPVNSESQQPPAVDCPDRFFMDWFSEHHLEALNEAGTDYFGTETQFFLKVTDIERAALLPLSSEEARTPEDARAAKIDRSPGFPATDNRQAAPKSAPKRRLTTTNINPEYTFDNFVVGSSTDMVFAAASAVAKNPGGHFNPLFIYGGVGLGKTHLMHAIGNAILEQDPTQKICYVSTENFMNELVASIRDRKTPEFKAKYRSMDVLLVDDVAFLTGKESTQEEFFHTFNALYDLKKQIVLTSDRSPKEITTLEERLRSRFEWGMTTDIQPPNLETRMAILKRKIEANNIMISDDVIYYIAENITDNIRRLEGALIRLLAFASLTGNEISLEMASEVLSSFFQSKSSGPVKIAEVMKAVGEVHDVTIDQLKSKRRTQDLARARQIAMYLSREMTGASLNQIGRAFGDKDHSTVSHACRKIAALMQSDARFRGAVLDIQDKIRANR